MHYGELTVNVPQQIVQRGEQIIDLTHKEFELLVYFIRNQGVNLTRDAIYQALWDFADDANDTRTVDLHVQRLRKKLQLADDIVTVFKVGYRMVAR